MASPEIELSLRIEAKIRQAGVFVFVITFTQVVDSTDSSRVQNESVSAFCDMYKS